MAHSCIGTERGAVHASFPQGKLFLGTNWVPSPGSVHGLVITVGLTQLRITWQKSLNELPRAGRSEGTSVGTGL